MVRSKYFLSDTLIRNGGFQTYGYLVINILVVNFVLVEIGL